MRKAIKRLKDLFTASAIQEIDADEIGVALSDEQVRTVWIQKVFEELQRINLEVDKRLLEGGEWSLNDLSARRKAVQDVIELVLAAKREVKRDVRPNRTVEVQTIDLDRMTA